MAARPVVSPADTRPMLAAMVGRLPAGKGWLFEPKWDGFRCIAATDSEGNPGLWSRRGTSLTAAFPEIAGAVADQLPPTSVLDGEIVRWADEGYLDFEALQRRNRTTPVGAARLSRREPCHLIAFDLLQTAGVAQIRLPLRHRRRGLEELISPDSKMIMVGMQTDDRDTALQWLDRLASVGVEGIVAKRADELYRPGQRGWEKIKHYDTTDVIIGAITGPLEAPDGLVFGRIHTTDGELHIAGRSVDLQPAEASAVAAAIRTAADDHPWPAQLPPSWQERTARDYQRVVPDVVAEIRVDVAAAYADGRPDHWRHRLRYLRLRTDLAVEEVPTDLDLST
ncbi:ATP-dependent DNA ligase [Microlunatus soli]|uniref:ATP dependent DNA ligase domain-containing protein n=1 Tax=Microlunatus soli TaxID=630515 RepID=A0A1H1N882_9ACTN|nr:ATP-dependent DNA ligase [Microlunatus soli]SDR95233.1 ATP dependent DNA ligase domain-containing protein [Microlunatus soli]